MVDVPVSRVENPVSGGLSFHQSETGNHNSRVIYPSPKTGTESRRATRLSNTSTPTPFYASWIWVSPDPRVPERVGRQVVARGRGRERDRDGGPASGAWSSTSSRSNYSRVSNHFVEPIGFARASRSRTAMATSTDPRSCGSNKNQWTQKSLSHPGRSRKTLVRPRSISNRFRDPFRFRFRSPDSDFLGQIWGARGPKDPVTGPSLEGSQGNSCKEGPCK